MSLLMTLRARLVADWRRAHRWASVRISGIGAALFGSAAFFPDMVREAWNALPPSLRDRLPDNSAQAVAALLFLLAIAGRLHQRKEKGQWLTRGRARAARPTVFGARRLADARESHRWHWP